MEILGGWLYPALKADPRRALPVAALFCVGVNVRWLSQSSIRYPPIVLELAQTLVVSRMSRSGAEHEHGLNVVVVAQ
jgi:hypothetical protein